MTKDNSLARLARAAGLHLTYRDMWGEERRLSDETARALLAALGIPAQTPPEITEAIRALAEAPWRRTLPPVQTQRAGQATRIPIIVPTASVERTFEWSLQSDAGAMRRDQVRLMHLPITGARSVDGRKLERRVFTLPTPLGIGHHRFEVSGDCFEDSTPRSMSLIVAPSQCYLPPELAAEKGVWGLAAQLYSLRSDRNWGIGDFGDLRALIDGTDVLGGGAVGLNPLHALFPDQPKRISPYSPSSRRFLNVLYLDVEAIPDLADCEAAQQMVAARPFQRRLARLRTSTRVRHAEVTKCKRTILELLFETFRQRHLGNGAQGRRHARARAFRRFQAHHGEALRRHAAFEALSERFGKGPDGSQPWQNWPEMFRHPESRAVAEFAATHQDRLEFSQYLQWQADIQLTRAADDCRERGMPIGLFRDLAVGVAPDGAEAWGDQDIAAVGVRIGAPPDSWSHEGQEWGLLPNNPIALRNKAYRPFVELIAANMRDAGAIRIDHILGFVRQFWIPAGAPATAGGYVRFPTEDLLNIVALESHRTKCLVVGEDLGTIPRGLRGKLAERGVLSYRLLYFERTRNGGFIAPGRYPRLSLAAVGTHDLPTLPGHLIGHDIAVRQDIDLFRTRVAATRAKRERERDIAKLLAALVRAGLLSRDIYDADMATPTVRAAVVEAAYCYLARSSARLVMVQIEDVLGEIEQINMPSTTSEHPNWRRKLAFDVDALRSDTRFLSIAGRLNDELGHGPP